MWLMPCYLYRIHPPEFSLITTATLVRARFFGGGNGNLGSQLNLLGTYNNVGPPGNPRYAAGVFSSRLKKGAPFLVVAE
jgi:hypothetical protein